MYAGVDGTGIPMRPDELAGRSGKQSDGSSKTREHLSRLANTIFGSGADLARKWAGDRYCELESDSFDDLLQAIRCQMPPGGETGSPASREFEYLSNNRQRMRYAYFRSLGLCVGSGVVESGCKVVIAQRLKRSGMFWGLKGANAIIALRYSLFSNSFNDFIKKESLARQSLLL
jgi:hypothetical protein